ncbi:MAG: tetratricopeptide repeat protein [Deltaproteobacteria bacterium]|nr:tetratricopeptide repeat protein [Deltaproteobacteria bacterium]
MIPAPHNPSLRGSPGNGRRHGAGCFLALFPALAFFLLAWPVHGWAQTENLLDRVSNQRMRTFEEQLTESMNTAMRRYVHSSRYVLAVRVIWNPEIVPLIENPEQTPDRQKLPGFPIFVRSSENPAVNEATPPFQRMEVKVLLDETLPEYYERFVRKIVPIVARFDYNRGDQVVVLKETFPVLSKEEQPPTLSEKDLMDAVGQKFQPGQLPPPQAVGVPAGMMGGAMGVPGGAHQGQAPSPAEAAQFAFDEGRYQEALRIVQTAFQQSTTNRERSYFLGMEGSIYYAMNNKDAAKAAWERALTFDPTNMDVHQVLNYFGGQQPAGNPQ